MARPIAIDRTHNVAIDTQGDILPISDMYDAWGDPASAWEDCVAILAGPDTSGIWWPLRVEEFQASLN